MLEWGRDEKAQIDVNSSILFFIGIGIIGISLIMSDGWFTCSIVH